jgi:hypothetical protein
MSTSEKSEVERISEIRASAKRDEGFFKDNPNADIPFLLSVIDELTRKNEEINWGLTDETIEAMARTRYPIDPTEERTAAAHYQIQAAQAGFVAGFKACASLVEENLYITVLDESVNRKRED